MAASFWQANYWLGGAGSGSGAPATPTLAIADNADGTGGVATITGADTLASLEVFSQSLTGQFGTDAWTSRGTRTGNGTISVAPGSGYYWWKAVSTLSGGTAVSNLVYQALTDSANSVLYSILQAVQARIQSLSLSGVSSGKIIVRKLPVDRNLTAPPYVIISPLKESINDDEGVNVADDIVYPVMVACVAADNQESTLAANLNSHTLWRQQIRKSFNNNPRLAGVNTVFNSTVEPADIVSSEAWAANLWASGLILRFQSRELRS